MAKKTTPVRKAVKSERPKPKSSVKPVPAKQAKAQSEAKGKPVKPTVQPTSNMVDSKRQLKIQKALYEIADTASSVKDMQSFYKKLHKIVGKLMYAENFIITLYDSATNMRSFPYYVDSAGDTASEPNPVPPGSIYADMLLHPVTLHFDRKRNEEETRAGRLGGTVAEDFVAVPLIENGQVIGGIIVQSYVKDIRYSDEDVAVLEFMAKHIATALTRARAIEETRQRNAELQVINSVQEGLASKLDFQGIVDLVGDKIQSIFNADIMMIAFKDPKENLVHYPYVIGDEKRYNIKSSKPGGFSGEVLKTGKSIVVNEHFDDRKVEFGSASLVADDPNAKQPQIKSAIYIPIKGNNAAIGVVSLQTEEREHAFSEASVRLLETIASSMGVALENARLFDETQRLFKAEQERVAELQIINSIQQGLAAELDFQAIVDLVGDKLREVFNTPDLIISWYDENANLLHYIYVYEHGKRLTTEPQTPVQGGRFETIRKSKQPVVWNTQAEYVGGVIPGTDQSKSLISVPIISSDRVLGLISIENFERENAFGESEQRLLSTISASLGNALENARLFKAEQERVAELQIINSVQQGLAAELDFQAIVDLVGDKLREVFSNGDLTITWYDEKAKLVNYLYGYEHGKRLPFMSRPPNPGGIYETEIKTRKPIIFNNAADYAKLNMTVIPGTDQSKSIISVPIISSDRFLGDISMENYERENAFGESEQRLLTTIAASLGTALENARLFDETQRLLKITEDRAAELAIINSVQAALAAELNIQGIYDAVGDKIREIFHQADMGIRIYDSQTNLIHYPYTYENGQRISIESSPLSEKGFAAHVIHNRQTLVINENMAEVEKQYGSFTIPGTGESKSELFVPLIVGEQARGLINLSDYEREHAFSDSDVRLLQTLANAMSVALENARLFDETQRLLKETEQRNAELKIINSVQQGVSSKL
ncbi:MAG TPA: GAF domain-containing protein, partial [Anaerolineales bacterium]|nr:GAF domain-containing protein [Anaerolineales bacterium]